MHSSIFFKLFPPPKFLLMPHVGINISDDAITFVEYSRPIGSRSIVKYGCIPIDQDIIEGGDIKNEQKLVSVLSEIVQKNNLSYAKLSIPEEKAYLFETEIPSYGDMNAISQNIEFKLEDNIPLSAPDAVFAFDILPGDHIKPWRASVSAVPRTYIERMLDIFRKSGITPVAFETIPRAIARVISPGVVGDIIVVHSMNRKTGIYIVSENAIGFTSTIAVGITKEGDMSAYIDIIDKEIRRVFSYWFSRNSHSSSIIKQVIVVGRESEDVTAQLRGKVADILPVHSVDVWLSVLDTTHYIPPILKSESYIYAPAAGLGL